MLKHIIIILKNSNNKRNNKLRWSLQRMYNQILWYNSKITSIWHGVVRDGLTGTYHLYSPLEQFSVWNRDETSAVVFQVSLACNVSIFYLWGHLPINGLHWIISLLLSIHSNIISPCFILPQCTSCQAYHCSDYVLWYICTWSPLLTLSRVLVHESLPCFIYSPGLLMSWTIELYDFYEIPTRRFCQTYS